MAGFEVITEAASPGRHETVESLVERVLATHARETRAGKCRNTRFDTREHDVIGVHRIQVIRSRSLTTGPDVGLFQVRLLRGDPDRRPAQESGGTCGAFHAKDWIALTRYCEDGDLEIDNNTTERSIRGVVVGRRNLTFFGSDQGGKAAPVLRSFVAPCQRVGVEPFAWFKGRAVADRHLSNLSDGRTAPAQLDPAQP
jgi:hypothetical protein